MHGLYGNGLQLTLTQRSVQDVCVGCNIKWLLVQVTDFTVATYCDRVALAAPPVVAAGAVVQSLPGRSRS